MKSILQLVRALEFRRFKSNTPINGKNEKLSTLLINFFLYTVPNYETGFSQPKQQSLADELDLLSLAYDPESGESAAPLNKDSSASGRVDHRQSSSASSNRRPNRAVMNKYPTGSVDKQRCYNCGQVGHISFDCQQPQVRKACYTCGNSGHLARDCPQSQRPIICYVCRQPGHLASKCPNTPNSQARS
jgi:cellular nucleic acid-binding protein